MKPKSLRRLTLISLLGAGSAGVGYYGSVLKQAPLALSHLDPNPQAISGILLEGISPSSLTLLPPLVDRGPLHRNPVFTGFDPLSPPELLPLDSSQPEPEDWDEIDQLKMRNQIIDIADRVIVTGNRSDFEALEKIGFSIGERDGEGHATVREFFELQVLRVDRFFFSRRGHRSVPIEVPTYFPKKKGEADLTVGELVHLLLDKSTPKVFRIRAAELLGKEAPGSQPPLPGYLLLAAGTDPSLDVIDEALLSFGKLTDIYPDRLFDTVPASVWWEYNRPKEGPAIPPLSSP